MEIFHTDLWLLLWKGEESGSLERCICSSLLSCVTPTPVALAEHKACSPSGEMLTTSEVTRGHSCRKCDCPWSQTEPTKRQTPLQIFIHTSPPPASPRDGQRQEGWLWRKSRLAVPFPYVSRVLSMPAVQIREQQLPLSLSLSLAHSRSHSSSIC